MILLSLVFHISTVWYTVQYKIYWFSHYCATVKAWSQVSYHQRELRCPLCLLSTWGWPYYTNMVLEGPCDARWVPMRSCIQYMCCFCCSVSIFVFPHALSFHSFHFPTSFRPFQSVFHIWCVVVVSDIVTISELISFNILLLSLVCISAWSEI